MLDGPCDEVKALQKPLVEDNVYPVTTALPAQSDDFNRLAEALAGQYELLHEIGRGGMGIVYLARDVRLDRRVAIKTLPPHLANDPVVRERFLREARTAGGLSHQNIVPIHRADEIAGHVFFVMGYVDGDSMAQRIRAFGHLDEREVVRELRDVASALDYAHAHGVIHRDVKAENILVERSTGRALVTDFGIARLAEAAPLTATGQVLGTVYYLSPEQVAGEAVDARSDIYSLGVAGFLALAGRFPFEAQLASAVLLAHVTKAAPPLRSVAPTVGTRLAAAIDRCLSKDPAARFQSSAQFARELAEIGAELPGTGVASSGVLVSDSDAQRIWGRAAELQEATSSQPMPALPPTPRAQESPTSGYSLADVRGSAREAGIATKAIDRALAEYGLAPAASSALAAVSVTDLTSKKNRFVGESLVIEYEAVVEGEVSERDFDVLGNVIQQYNAGAAGTLTAVGRSLNWNAKTGARRSSVTIVARRGKTTIRCTEDLTDLTGAVFGPTMGAGGGGGGGAVFGVLMGTHHPLIAAAGWLATVAATFGLARTIFAGRARGRRAKLRALLDKLTQEVRESIAGQ
jgi:serine/threonine-protein kinase